MNEIQKAMMAPIYIATKYIQKRKHRKKRINKKWQKRYGYYEINYMPHNEIVTMDDGTILMTKRTFERMKSHWIDIPLIAKEDKDECKTESKEV